LLQPADYGIVATSGLFTVLAGLLMDGGLSAVLVGRRDLPEDVQGAAATLILLLSIILALGIAAVAPVGAVFFKNANLASVLRVCAVQLPLSALAVVPVALLARDMNFRLIAVGQSVASIVQGVATLVMAYLGAGYWALIYGTLLGFALKAAVAWLSVPRKPAFNMRFYALRPLMASSSQMVAQRLLYFISGDFDTFLLGRFAGVGVLGPYSLAKTASHSALDQIAGTVNQITLPSFAAKIGDVEAQLNGLVAVISVAGSLVFPLFWLLGALSPLALPLAFGPRWAALIFPFTAFTLMLPLRGIYTLLDSAVVGTGGMSTTFKNMMVWAAIMMPSLFLGAMFGANATASAWVVAFPLVFLSSMKRIASRFETTAWRLLQPLVLPAACSAGACLLTLAIGLLLQHRLQPLSLLFIEAPAGAVCYWLLMRLYGGAQYDQVRRLVLRLLVPNSLALRAR
jgi:O-antigen/teichoic acid export membrane protein